jgi:isoleucyl-tRNA synthetase
MTDINSIHLQDFPDVKNIIFNDILVKEMDLVQSICSVALFLRDRQNLRVRLPLNSIRIVGKDVELLGKYSDIIADEINVKNVLFENDLEKYANFVLEVDLKKLGAKYGEKLKDIMKGVKTNDWKQNGENIEVGGVVLNIDEYMLKLKSKDENAKNIETLPNNKYLVELDFNITKELELEGIARDVVRNIQQTRKEKDLSLGDRIKLLIKSNNEKTIEAINMNADYIKEQTLALELKCEKSDGELEIELEKII